MYNTNSQRKFKILMLTSSFCDYSDAYVLCKWLAITITVTGDDEAARHTKEIKE